MIELLELKKMHVPEERELIDKKIKYISRYNPLRHNPKFKMYLNQVGKLAWEYHSPDKEAKEMHFATKIDKRATFKKKINKKQMHCSLHVKPYPIYYWERQKMVNIKMMFFSNCIQGPKIFYLYEKNTREIPQIMNINMLSNLFVFEFDMTKENTVKGYNKYHYIDGYKLHDFFKRGKLNMSKRPFDKINKRRKLSGLPTRPKPVNHSFYSLADSSSVPNKVDYL